VIKNRPEMIRSRCAHNLAFLTGDMMMLHLRQEIADMMRLCKDNGVRVRGLRLGAADDSGSSIRTRCALLMTVFRTSRRLLPPTRERVSPPETALPEGPLMTR
jgi:hypothetical protein